MITSVRIKNYKQFKDLRLDNLKRINLIAGKNNIGKTSVLECLFMFYDRMSPQMTIKQFNWRGMNSVALNSQSLWQPIFHNFDTSYKIEIEVKHDNLDSNCHSAVYEHLPSYIPDQLTSTAIDPTAQGMTSTSNSEALHVKYKNKHENTGDVFLHINNGQLSLTTQKLKPITTRASFIFSNVRLAAQDDALKLGELLVNEGIADLIEYLKIMEPKLLNLQIIPSPSQNMIYCDVGYKKPVPISLMGEGTTKLLSILLNISHCKNGIVLLDELENGIHYSTFPIIWKAISKMAKAYNVQLFITTHNYDFLHGLNDIYTDEMSDDFTFIRLDSNDGRIIPKHYDGEMFNAALDRDWEIR